MQNSINNQKIVLASQSPRRKYLLEQAGLEFIVIPSSFDESSIEPGEPGEYVQILARAKADDIAEKHPGSWVIGADTIVVIDGRILGKPGSRDEARAMLGQLSGKTHQVHTGFCIQNRQSGRAHLRSVKTDVIFKDLSRDEIEWYIHTEEPFDKAGAYAIQGLGTFLVREIRGSYTNVVGLPVCEVIEYLIKEGVVGLKPNHAES